MLAHSEHCAAKSGNRRFVDAAMQSLSPARWRKERSHELSKLRVLQRAIARRFIHQGKRPRRVVTGYVPLPKRSALCASIPRNDDSSQRFEPDFDFHQNRQRIRGHG